MGKVLNQIGQYMLIAAFVVVMVECERHGLWVTASSLALVLVFGFIVEIDITIKKDPTP